MHVFSGEHSAQPQVELGAQRVGGGRRVGGVDVQRYKHDGQYELKVLRGQAYRLVVGDGAHEREGALDGARGLQVPWGRGGGEPLVGAQGKSSATVSASSPDVPLHRQPDTGSPASAPCVQGGFDARRGGPACRVVPHAAPPDQTGIGGWQLAHVTPHAPLSAGGAAAAGPAAGLPLWRGRPRRTRRRSAAAAAAAAGAAEPVLPGAGTRC